ncbi:hypothetical protein TWF506_000860 [Arthrobotrys conoides]|uniref:Uncharacterized protein n=1 Tax=Arthrobotrys conoides TaxID=74498 RepID=A0AAN8NS02_9PEZI
MQGLVLFLLSASQLLGQGQALALAVSPPEEALHREHYGVRIRDVLDHVYGKPPLRRRSEGEMIPECRPGSTPHYQNGVLTACSFETSVKDYNKAIRSIYAKRTRRSLEEAAPVYLFKRDGGKFKDIGFDGSDGKYKINGGGHPVMPDDDEVIHVPKTFPGDTPSISEDDLDLIEGVPLPSKDDMSLDEVQTDVVDNLEDELENNALPTNWTITPDDGGCYNSGSWVKLEVIGSIRLPWCLFLHNTRNIAAVRHMTFFKASIDPTQPGPLLRSSDNRTMAVNTEYLSQAFLVGENDVWALCTIATRALLDGRCHGESKDTRGGWQVVRRTHHKDEPWNEEERSVSFGWDPTSGPECC